jgi:hypothetical protein
VKLGDHWRADLGVRWDRQDASREQHDRSASFDRYSSNPSAGGLPGATMYEGFGPKKCNCLFGHTFNKGFAPRLGVAYQIDSKTVLRAGWGFVYGRTAPTSTVGALVGAGFNTLNFTSNNFGGDLKIADTTMTGNTGGHWTQAQTGSTTNAGTAVGTNCHSVTITSSTIQGVP